MMTLSHTESGSASQRSSFARTFHYAEGLASPECIGIILICIRGFYFAPHTILLTKNLKKKITRYVIKWFPFFNKILLWISHSIHCNIEVTTYESEREFVFIVPNFQLSAITLE